MYICKLLGLTVNIRVSVDYKSGLSVILHIWLSQSSVGKGSGGRVICSTPLSLLTAFNSIHRVLTEALDDEGVAKGDTPPEKQGHSPSLLSS